MTRSPIELFWTAKNYFKHTNMQIKLICRSMEEYLNPSLYRNVPNSRAVVTLFIGDWLLWISRTKPIRITEHTRSTGPTINLPFKLAKRCRSVEDELGFASSRCICFQAYFSAQLPHEMEWWLLQLATSRRTIHGGAYFSAVCG